MNIDGIEYVRADEVQMTEAKDHPFTIGKAIVIRTVTMIQTGILKAVGEKELVLTDAAWIAETGRFADFLKHGPIDSSAEVEPFPDGEVIVGRGAIIDAMHVNWDVPRNQK
jgi:hypothetical protein